MDLIDFLVHLFSQQDYIGGIFFSHRFFFMSKIWIHATFFITLQNNNFKFWARSPYSPGVAHPFCYQKVFFKWFPPNGFFWFSEDGFLTLPSKSKTNNDLITQDEKVLMSCPFQSKVIFMWDSSIYNFYLLFKPYFITFRRFFRALVKTKVKWEIGQLDRYTLPMVLLFIIQLVFEIYPEFPPMFFQCLHVKRLYH